jgi:hemoglobin
MGNAMKNQLLRMPVLLAPVILGLGAACHTQEKSDPEFFTSGSHEADQRAEQRVTKEEQISGKSASKDEAKKTLFERLGGQAGLQAIVADFVDRALADPRTNWQRKGVKSGAVLGIGGHSVEWTPTAENLDALRRHLAQFLELATGGPTEYTGRDMQEVHAKMKISNDEFNASVGDLKATLDKLAIKTGEQKELLAIIESTRPQVVTVK